MGLYSDKLWKACRLIKAYNQRLSETKLPSGVKPPKQIHDERFVEKLVGIGGVSDELIRQCSWEELENCGLPRLLARDIAKVFRANEVEPDDIVRQWRPLLKQWKLHWRDHIDLAEKLDAAAREHGWHLETEDHVKPKLSAQEFKRLLERIRDEHLQRDMFGALGHLDFTLSNHCPREVWEPVLQSWELSWEEHEELAKRLNGAAIKHGWKVQGGKLEIPNLTKGKEFQKLLVDIRDEYLAELDS
jgi:hypothetical protein